MGTNHSEKLIVQCVEGRAVHPLTVSLMDESKGVLQIEAHRRWVQTKDFGGVLYLTPAD